MSDEPRMIEEKSNVIHVDFTNKCKRKPFYPVIIKPVYGEELQD